MSSYLWSALQVPDRLLPWYAVLVGCVYKHLLGCNLHNGVDGLNAYECVDDF